MVTAWEPTPEELVRLNQGACIHLVVLGSVHPPVMLEVGEAMPDAYNESLVPPADPQSLAEKPAEAKQGGLSGRGSNKPILCMDFDGVIHSYTSGWQGDTTISDPVVPGFFEWAEQAAKQFTLVIYSSRSKNPDAISAMQFYLYEQRKLWRAAGGKSETQDPLSFEFAAEKPAAFLTIDDRAIQFDGTWPDVNELRAFKPWNKR
jgi:hypothetical protein